MSKKCYIDYQVCHIMLQCVSFIHLGALVTDLNTAKVVEPHFRVLNFGGLGFCFIKPKLGIPIVFRSKKVHEHFKFQVWGLTDCEVMYQKCIFNRVNFTLYSVGQALLVRKGHFSTLSQPFLNPFSPLSQPFLNPFSTKSASLYVYIQY